MFGHEGLLPHHVVLGICLWQGARNKVLISFYAEPGRSSTGKTTAATPRSLLSIGGNDQGLILVVSGYEASTKCRIGLGRAPDDARRSVSRVLSRLGSEPPKRGWPFIWDVRHRTPHATDPSGGAEGPPGGAIAGGRLPLLLGLAPGGVCPAAPVTGGAVRSYRTISPLPPAPPPLPSPQAEEGRVGADGLGGMFSVALSLGSPPPGVTRHRAFRGARTFLPPPKRKAAIRPSGPAYKGRRAVYVKPARGRDRSRSRPARR